MHQKNTTGSLSTSQQGSFLYLHSSLWCIFTFIHRFSASCCCFTEGFFRAACYDRPLNIEAHFSKSTKGTSTCCQEKQGTSYSPRGVFLSSSSLLSHCVHCYKTLMLKHSKAVATFLKSGLLHVTAARPEATRMWTALLHASLVKRVGTHLPMHPVHACVVPQAPTVPRKVFPHACLAIPRRVQDSLYVQKVRS